MRDGIGKLVRAPCDMREQFAECALFMRPIRQSCLFHDLTYAEIRAAFAACRWTYTLAKLSEESAEARHVTMSEFATRICSQVTSSRNLHWPYRRVAPETQQGDEGFRQFTVKCTGPSER
jgi:hypothetical protein